MLNALSNALMEGHLIFATKRLNPNEVTSIITTFQQPNLLPKKLSDKLSAAIKSNGNMFSEAIGSCTIYAIINSTIIMWKDERKWLTCYSH